MEVSGWIGLAWLESHRQPWFSRTGCQTYEFGLIGNSSDAGCGNREVRNRRQMALATWHWPKVAMALALGGDRMWLPSCCCVGIEYASSWLLIDDLSAVPNGFQGLTIHLHMALTILHVAQRPSPCQTYWAVLGGVRFDTNLPSPIPRLAGRPSTKLCID